MITITRHISAGFKVISPHSPGHGQDRASRDVAGTHRGDVGGVVFMKLGGRES